MSDMVLFLGGFTMLFLGFYEMREMKNRVSTYLGKEEAPASLVKKFFFVYQSKLPIFLQKNGFFIFMLHVFGTIGLFFLFFRHHFIFAFSLAFLWGYGVLLWLHEKKRADFKKLNRALPDFLDLLNLFLSAGLPLGAACDRLIPFVLKSCPLLAFFLQRVSRDLQMGGTFASAFKKEANVFASSRLPEIAFYIDQAERYGTPLSQIFKNLSEDMRQEYMIKLEEKSQKMGAILSLPLILCFLPALLIIIFAPALLQLSVHLKLIFGN